MSRATMDMRAKVERNIASGTDAHGHPVAPDFQPYVTMPCRVWSKSRRELTDGDKVALIEDMHGIFPLTADILESDEISSVTDRQGNEILSGRVRVDAIQWKRRHIEVALQRVQP